MTDWPLWMDAYLERIGWQGPPLGADTGKGSAARDTLNALIVHHLAAMPFGNIDSFLHRPVSVEIDDIVDKLITRRREGYCFEQNFLFQHILSALGYTVEPLLGRVLLSDPDPSVQQRTHMVSRIWLNEEGRSVPVLADVGFGGNVTTGLLDFVSDVEQHVPHGLYKMVESDDGRWTQYINIAGEWRPTYILTFDPVYPVDIALANWWVSTWPQSHFRESLKAALSPPGERIALLNRQFTVYRSDGTRETAELSDAEIVDVLTTRFGIAIPDEAALLARLKDIA